MKTPDAAGRRSTRASTSSKLYGGVRCNRGSTTGQPRLQASTYVSNRDEDADVYYVAVLQGRGEGVEVGIAAINVATGHVSSRHRHELGSLTGKGDRLFSPIRHVGVSSDDNEAGADTKDVAFNKTLHQLHLYPPQKVLIPDTELPSRLGGGADRGWRKGLEFLSLLGVDDDNKAFTMMNVASKQYALCAASAVIAWLHMYKNITFQNGSLNVQYAPSEGIMYIDPDTASNLELVRNKITGKTDNTLFGILNHCHTPMGARLLRASILQPCNIASEIDERLDAVQELLHGSEKIKRLRAKFELLPKADLDTTIAQLSQGRPMLVDVATTSSRINMLLHLSTYLESMEIVRLELVGSSSKLLQKVEKIEILVHRGLCKIKGLVTPADLWAVKPTCNPLLETARKTYEENVSDIYELLEQVNRRHSLDCVLEIVDHKYHFATPKDQIDLLPTGFHCTDRGKYKIRFTSHELVGLAPWQSLTRQGALYRCTETIAVLDVVASFAYTAEMRPEFAGSLAVRMLALGDLTIRVRFAADGIRFLIELWEWGTAYQTTSTPPMDRQTSSSFKVQTCQERALTSANVPAEYASFKLHDALLTRMSNNDSMEEGLSTFALEMATSAMMLGEIGLLNRC
ncbi:hypothetical protein IAR55_001782 [Kwoniella newhampshirensis]|uniref:DNA mismatch repair protein MutS core domain-containing protein n=1 Tax=Kwoniella newhampshirensis TaxID=1651941 RepID=A0AAW0Z399_9TREE